MSKNKSIEELITQLKLAIEKAQNEMAECQRKLYTKQVKDIIQNMGKTIPNSRGE